jgi:hypothetical protein
MSLNLRNRSLLTVPNRSLSRSRNPERALLLFCALPLRFRERMARGKWPANEAGQCIVFVVFCSGCGE